ncbi:MAG: hypothetical protein QOD00_2726 [Blastocatellia bacterium]|nr:hypothetical protein [Blastocatellia bacterium]
MPVLSLSPVSGVSPLLVVQVIGNVRDDDALLEEERAFEDERALGAQQLLPPAGGDEVSQHDRHDVFMRAPLDPVYVAQVTSCVV